MNSTVTINGVPLNVHTQGEGPAIYAHHGAPGLGTHATPAKAFKPLTDAYRVVTFDARGSGLSGAVPPYTHAQWVDDWARLMDHHGDDRVILTGGSYGGYIAQEFALAHPDRVSHLILRDTAASHRFEAQAKRTALSQAGRFPGITEDLLDMLFEGRVPSDGAFRDAFMTIAPLYDAKLDEAAVSERFKSAIFRAETHNQAFSQNVPNFDLTGRLHEIQAPTLVVVGRHDWITPVEASEEIAAGIPNAELVVFENSGHSPQLEESDKFVDTVRSFLARHA